MQDRKVAKLCSNYARLSAIRATLDRCIQLEIKERPIDQGNVHGQSSASEANESPTEALRHTVLLQASIGQIRSVERKAKVDFDLLWIELDDILTQQSDVTVALIETPATNVTELRLKAAVLTSVLQAIDRHENELALNLSDSVVRDIATLFHQP